MIFFLLQIPQNETIELLWVACVDCEVVCPFKLQNLEDEEIEIFTSECLSR